MEGGPLPARVTTLAGGGPGVPARVLCWPGWVRYGGSARVGNGTIQDRLSQTPLRAHLPPVRGQFRHACPDALAIMEDDMNKLLLTPTEAAAALGIGRSKVYELMQTGQLPSVHIGACRRVPTDALNAFLEQLRAAG